MRAYYRRIGWLLVVLSPGLAIWFTALAFVIANTEVDHPSTMAQSASLLLAVYALAGLGFWVGKLLLRIKPH